MDPTTEEEMATVTRSRPPEDPAALDHRGLFGMRGGLRDIVGLLGDAFLTQAGRPTVYQPQRQEEMAADALQGFYDGNEEDRMAALTRLNRIDPYKATSLKKDLDSQELTKMYRQNMLDTRADNSDIRREEAQRKKVDSYIKLGGLARAANEKTWPAIRTRLAKMAELYGIDEDIPEQYDPMWVEGFANMGMTSYQGVRSNQIERDVTDKINKRRAPQPRNAPRPVAIIRNGKRVWVRPEDAIDQEAPAPGKGDNSKPSKEPPVPKGFKKLTDGRLQNIETGEIFTVRKRG